ncbi:glycosyltransferase family 2 protein [Moraxella osloensis]|nr:glycosyltransferase family 2 protein [Moraxella osloensis]
MMITVGIPFYNAEDFLAEAIKSVLAQTYQNWELLLIDDGSKDKSLEIAKTFESQDNRIRVISDGVNKKLPGRLNQIIYEANGDYIARMDADDIMHPRRLEKQLKILQMYSDIDILGSNAYVIDENNLVFGQRFAKTDGLQKVDHFIHPTVIGKKQWFLDNPYDEKAIRIEDAELWYRTKSFSNFMITNEPLLFYREFGNNYYKKYFQANGSAMHILNKYPEDKFWKNFFLSNKVKGSMYKILNVIGKEQVLIDRRNEKIFEKKINFEKWLEIHESK